MDNTAGGEFDVPIGAVVEFSDSGQLKLIDDDGEVSIPPCVLNRLYMCVCVYLYACAMI